MHYFDYPTVHVYSSFVREGTRVTMTCEGGWVMTAREGSNRATLGVHASLSCLLCRNKPRCSYPGMKHSAYTTKTPKIFIYTLTRPSGLANMRLAFVPNPNATTDVTLASSTLFTSKLFNTTDSPVCSKISRHVQRTRHVVSYPDPPHRNKSDRIPF